MKDKINKIKDEVLEMLKDIKDDKTLKDLETKYLGRKGEFTQILRELKSLSVEAKKEVGQLANQVKQELQDKFNELKEGLEDEDEKNKKVDVTLPGKKSAKGHLNPLTILQNEIEEVFSSMGFMIMEGPELESDYYNFESLNISRNHPARDMQDTFYIDQKNKDGEFDLVMRTHTSPVQVRAMQQYGAPFKGIFPGRVFRNEAIDACHDTTFYQLEGLMIDKNISIANLIAVLKEMLSGIFEQEVKVRLRPGYFPFVEPGFEVDMSCTICGGKGCPSCKNTGWLEMVGAGMVHPKVLENGGIDPKKYTGFAFGIGLTRLAMMRYGIKDIRLFNSGDMRFSEQF